MKKRVLPRASIALKAWADEHIIVDDFSSDRTVEIAHSNGAMVSLDK